MISIVKWEMRKYLKRPIFWIGLLLVIFGIFQELEPYLENWDIVSQQNTGKSPGDVDITDGYVPSDEKRRRQTWEDAIQASLVDDFQMKETDAKAVITEMKKMSIEKACEYLEEKYHYLDAMYLYEESAYHQGTEEEIKEYIGSKLEEHSFSYYFSRKFADFTGLFMAFFATVLLATLFLQDMRRNTYELLHTKPFHAIQYVTGKAAGGFLVCLTALAILNLFFWGVCLIETRGMGFEVHLLDFIRATCLYILPNMLMIVCVYELVSLVFKNPLPAVPLLVLYMVYSNMGSRNEEGIYGYYGRPLAIMVRFPGLFFDTAPPPMALQNQCFLILAAVAIICFSVQLWKRRRL